MALIKTANSARLVKDAVVLDMAALDRQAERILTAARAKADQIVAEAQAEANRLTGDADVRGHTAGHERGLNDGREAGRTQGHADAIEQATAEIQQIITSWTSALDSWEQARSAMQQEACEDVLRFAFALAEKIVHRAIQHDPSVVKEQLRSAIAMIGRPHEIAIGIHPEDRPQVEELMPKLSARLKDCAHVELMDDASIDRGGCRVKTRGGAIDATIRTQLDRIAEALLPGNASLNIEEATARKPDEAT